MAAAPDLTKFGIIKKNPREETYLCKNVPLKDTKIDVTQDLMVAALDLTLSACVKDLTWNFNTELTEPTRQIKTAFPMISIGKAVF